ncbi:MAG: DedA family protein [Gammaproteobacteria bacterium]|nr:DedA family protein [Gammaproteobacteria bacterium]MDH5730252.1 DedA family protein [Gammaproteobacteria bacterium]
MKLFGPLYDRCLSWAQHRHAQYYLAAVSFTESSFFVVPPDFMLIPMAVAKPAKAWFYAHITLVMSILGGLFGYAIGMFGFELVKPHIIEFGYEPAYTLAQEWFRQWGFWAILLAGFSPIPYKIFTIASGAVGMPFLPFLFGSIISRGARFYLVAGSIYYLGKKVEPLIREYIEYLGWLFVVIAIVAYFILR